METEQHYPGTPFYNAGKQQNKGNDYIHYIDKLNLIRIFIFYDKGDSSHLTKYSDEISVCQPTEFIALERVK
ncbi:hypothetical protein [Thalassospira sp.]|uniref:hypothetical protein n=1 Tax=Thalassospira sp. TaxID=1912094 RepID=UPI003AA85FD4